MLKKSTLILFLSIASIYANAQTGWFKQKINDKVTVGFPIEPKKINDQNIGINKDGVVYLVTYLDLLKATGLTSEVFNQSVTTQDFADEFLDGMAPTMPKYKFEKIKIITLKNQPTYQITGRDEVNKTTVYMNAVFVDGMVYNLTTVLPDGKSSKDKEIFSTFIEISK